MKNCRYAPSLIRLGTLPLSRPSFTSPCVIALHRGVVRLVPVIARAASWRSPRTAPPARPRRRRAAPGVKRPLTGNVRVMSEAYSSYSQPASISSRSPSCELVRILVVVQDAGVRAAADDRVIGDVGVVAAELVQQLRHHLVLHAPGTREAHRALVRGDGDARRLAHRVELRARLEQPHVVQQVIERDELLRRLHAGARLRLQAVDPADHALIELRVQAHRVVHARAVLHQARQDVVDVADRERIVRAVVARRALGSGAAAVPGLARRIAIAHEQHVLRLRAGPGSAPRPLRARRSRSGRRNRCRAGSDSSTSLLRGFSGTAGRMAMPPLPIIFISWRRRRANSSLRMRT